MLQSVYHKNRRQPILVALYHIGCTTIIRWSDEKLLYCFRNVLFLFLYFWLSLANDSKPMPKGVVIISMKLCADNYRRVLLSTNTNFTWTFEETSIIMYRKIFQELGKPNPACLLMNLILCTLCRIRVFVYFTRQNLHFTLYTL